MLASGNRREERDLVAGTNRRLGARDVVIDCDTHRAAGRQLGGPRAAAPRQPGEERGYGGYITRQIHLYTGRAEDFAQTGEINELHHGDILTLENKNAGETTAGA